MSIYIKDVEMPKDHNHVTITIWSNGAANYGLYNRGESLVDFKSVEVVSFPSHVRLVNMDSKTFPTFHRNPSNDYMKGWNACLRSVQQQPTIILENLKEE